MLPGTATFSDGHLVTPLLRRASDNEQRRARIIAFGLSHALSSVVGGSTGALPSGGVAPGTYDNATAVSLWDLLYGEGANEEARGAAKDEVEDTLAALGTAPPSEPLDIKVRRRRERMGQEALRVVQGALVPTLCSYVVSDAAPKMIFVGGQGSILLRSVDRCRTWRTIEITPSQAPEAHVECREDEDDDATLDEILNLMNPTHEEDGAGPKVGGSTRPDIFQVRVAEVGGAVAVCGQDGLLAVAVDNGRTFTSYPRMQLDEFENNGKRSFVNKLRSPQRLVGIHMVEFLYVDGSNGRHPQEGPHDGAVTFASSSGVFVAGYAVRGLGTVEFTFLYQIMTAQEVGCIRVVCGSLWVSTKGAVCVCAYNPKGRLAVAATIPHKGGTLRSMTHLPHTYVAALDKGSLAKITQTLETDTTRVLTTNGEVQEKGVRKAFSYSAATPSVGDVDHEATLGNCVSVVVGGVPFTLFHVMGTGTEVVDYDFSALLAVGWAPQENATMLVSTLINTSYTSLVKSAGAAEKVGTAVAMGSTGPNLIRSNRSGISTSLDGGQTWSPPTHAFTGEVEAGPRRGGEPFCVGCGSKQCVVLSPSAFLRGKGESGCEVVTLNASLRTKMLYTIAAMR
jgi:hypothetical protein